MKIMAYGPITSWEIDGETVETVSNFIFLSSKITADGDCSHEIKRRLLLGRKVMTNLDSIFKSRDIILPTKVHLVKAMAFSSGHVWIWELDCAENWVWKNWYFWTVVLEKTLESPLDFKDIQAVHPKGDQSWLFIARTDTEAETPTLWPPDVKNWLIRKDLDAGKDWRWEEKGTTEDKMVVWHYWHDGHEFEQTLGVDDGKEVWRAAVHGVTKSWTQLSVWTELNWILVHRAHLSMGFSRQEYWSVLPWQSFLQGIFLAQKSNQCLLSFLPWQEDSVPLAPPRKPLVRIGTTKKTTNNKCWGGCGETETLMHCWWGCKFIQQVWKMVWSFL